MYADISGIRKDAIDKAIFPPCNASDILVVEAMLHFILQGLLITSTSWVLWRIIRPYISKSTLRNIPGPSPSSFWRGNLPELFDRHGWDFQDTIDKDGQAVVRFTGMFRKQCLYVFDPKALHHIVLKDHDVQRPPWFTAAIRLTFGPGVLGVLGKYNL
ncbi:hypothetical protein NM688_g5260 [Phlebia brevispora]|uniref:Uncharacterized protein n=1 Tax=Phlebia brevispora TaxID=194682 RepID=A0ACC1SXX3_9APHY|nr:hypothetical protein NM688_g5260 [Phlebia brevispora]